MAPDRPNAYSGYGSRPIYPGSHYHPGSRGPYPFPPPPPPPMGSYMHPGSMPMHMGPPPPPGAPYGSMGGYMHMPSRALGQIDVKARDAGKCSTSQKSNPYPMQARLEKVLANREKFLQSAMGSFKQFDRDNSGTLNFDECRQLIDRLVLNLSLPPIDDATLQAIFNRFNSSDIDELNPDDFAQMFWQILLRVRDKYYPTRKMCVRRAFFVGRVALAENQIKHIFIFDRKLGAGSFGEVHLVTERSSGLCRCCKTINKDKAAVPVEQIEAEVEVLKTLDHPNIIKIFEVYEDYNNLYIIQEVCEGGELLARVTEAVERKKVLTEKYVREIIKQLLSALTYFHSKKIVHKDLKPENVLFQDSDPHSAIKVIDFGLAEIFNRADAISNNAAGTVLYMAPEVFARRVSFKCDIWSAGCMMFLLMTGHLPFMGRNLQEVRNKITKTDPPYDQYCRHVSAEAMDLLRQMLTKSPRNRISARDALSHPWFESSNTVADVELTPDLCNNLISYAKHSGLKAALMNLMTHQLNFNGSQIKRLSALFKQLDTDNSGTLSRDELSAYLRQAGLETWDINQILMALDLDSSGEVSYTEFLAAAFTWRESELNVMWTAFSKMDKDGDGKISVNEFVQLFNGDGKASKLLKEEDVESIIASIDKNGDGVIEWDEFLEYMRGPS